MAKFSNSSGSLYLNVYIDQASQNITANTSTVNWRITVNHAGGYRTYNKTGDSSLFLNLNGSNVHTSYPRWETSGSETTLASGSSVIEHNSDGTRTVSLSCTFYPENGLHREITVSGSLGLTTIPRSSSVRVGAGVIGSVITININRQNPSFKHTLRYKWAGKSGTIASNVDTSTSWTIPLDFANDIPNSASGTGTIYVDTYSGSTKTGTQSTTFTASVPGNVKPTFSGITLSDLNGAAQNLIPSGNTFIQIISNIKVTFNGAKGVYGSSITGYRAEIVGRNQATSSNGGSLGIMNYHGTIKIRASVSDSRGRWSDASEVSVTVLEYFAPALSFSIARTGSTSSTLTATRNAKIAPLTVAGRQRNTMTLTFKVARLGTTNFQVDNGQATGAWTSISSLVNSQANLAGNYLANQSWVVIGTLEDKFTRTEFMVNVATESVVFSYDRSGVGVNKIRERGALDVKGDIYANDQPIQQYQLTNNDGSLSRGSAQWDGVWNKKGTEFGWRSGKYADNPTGNDWGLFQNYWLDSWKGVQFFTGVTSNRFFFRTYNNNTEWKPSQWKEVATKDDIQSHTQGTDWQNLPLQNGWVYHPDHNGIQYSKSFDGVVYFRGVGSKGKTAYGTVIARLPVGFRPLHSTYIFALNDDFSIAVLCILTSGEIVVKNNVDNTWLNFDNISFKI
jgi:hypothetical protein